IECPAKRRFSWRDYGDERIVRQNELILLPLCLEKVRKFKQAVGNERYDHEVAQLLVEDVVAALGAARVEGLAEVVVARAAVGRGSILARRRRGLVCQKITDNLAFKVEGR